MSLALSQNAAAMEAGEGSDLVATRSKAGAPNDNPVNSSSADGLCETLLELRDPGDGSNLPWHQLLTDCISSRQGGHMPMTFAVYATGDNKTELLVSADVTSLGCACDMMMRQVHDLRRCDDRIREHDFFWI